MQAATFVEDSVGGVRQRVTSPKHCISAKWLMHYDSTELIFIISLFTSIWDIQQGAFANNALIVFPVIPPKYESSVSINSTILRFVNSTWRSIKLFFMHGLLHIKYYQYSTSTLHPALSAWWIIWIMQVTDASYYDRGLLSTHGMRKSACFIGHPMLAPQEC